MKGKFKTLVDRNRWFKSVPNALTLCNSLCGFAAILYTLRVYDSRLGNMEVFAISAWIILCAMVFDALDGFAARIFNAASMHGLQMDSLADMVTFGVAPAVIVAIMTHCLKVMNQWQNLMVYGFCAIYLGCAALRLATYNVHAILEKKSGDRFTGLPSPGAAAAICSIVIFYRYYSGPIAHLAFVLPVYAAVLGLLMVSNIPYQHMGKWIFSVKRNKKRMVVFLLILLAVIVFKIAAIAALINIYIFSGPIMAIINKIGIVIADRKEKRSKI
ncbi:MAG: CDP-alcohol phosphatidyltransferase family protein [Victivallaceae bacterium]